MSEWISLDLWRFINVLLIIIIIGRNKANKGVMFPQHMNIPMLTHSVWLLCSRTDHRRTQVVDSVWSPPLHGSLTKNKHSWLLPYSWTPCGANYKEFFHRAVSGSGDWSYWFIPSSPNGKLHTWEHYFYLLKWPFRLMFFSLLYCICLFIMFLLVYLYAPL